MQKNKGSCFTTIHASSILKALTALILFSITPARAATRNWSNTAGGVFNTPANWQTAIAPSASDIANFNLNSASPYTVALSAPATVTQLILDQDNALFDLSGFTLTASSTSASTVAVTIGETAGVTGTMSLQNGTLNARFFKIGDFGAGVLNLSNGAVVNSPLGTVYLGVKNGSSGTVTLSGAGTTWSADSHAVGIQGDASLTVSNGASLITTGNAPISTSTTSHATVTITGAGSSWTGATNVIYVGYTGQGSLTVNDLALLSAKTLTAGIDATSTATITLDGATAAGRSTMNISAGVLVADNGNAALNITNGALFTEAGEFDVGQGTGTGNILVSGAAAGNNAELNITGALLLGRFSASNASIGAGNGTLTVGPGGSSKVTGTTYLGAATAGVGSVIINGGAFSTGGLVALNGSSVTLNSGSLILTGGSFSPVSNSLSIVGATAADTATVKFTNSTTANLTGSLYVGGTAATAGPGAGLLSIESGANITFAGPTKLWTGGTLNIAGGTLKTAGIQLAGGNFSFTSGGLYLTGTSLTLGDTGLLGANLTLAGSSADRNALSVSGTTTLDPGSSLTINGGLFSTGKLVNNGGAISFGNGSFSITNDNFTIGAGSAVGSTLNLTAGRSLSVSGVVTIDPGASLTVNGGAFSASSLVNNGSFDFVSGTLGGSSDLIIDPGQLLGANLTLGAGRNLAGSQGLIIAKNGTATMSVSAGGTASSSRGYIAQLAGSNGTVSLTDSGSKWSISSTLAIGGGDSTAGGTASLTIANSASVTAGSTITIYPTASVKVDSASLSGGSIINKGVFELANTATVSGNFTNTATLKKTGTGTATLNGALNNSATVQVIGGTLALGNGAATSSGSFTIADGATLSFAGSYTGDPNSTLSAASSLTGAGTALFADGQHIFNGTVNLTNLAMGNGDAELNTAATVTHLTFNANSYFDYHGLWVNKTLAAQTMDFASGLMRGAGVLNVSGPINFTGFDPKYIYDLTINASADTLWTGNGDVSMARATFNNPAGVTFEARHDYAGQPPITFGGSSSTFNNYGSFVKSTGSLTIVKMGNVFNNYGTVDLQNGTLQFTGGGTSTGSYTGAAGTTLIIGDQSDNTFTFQPASSITTAGDLQLLGAPINFSGHLNVAGASRVSNTTFLPGADLQSFGTSLFIGVATFSTGATQTLPATTLNYDPARIMGTDDLTITGPFTWIGGTINDTGHLHLSAGGSITTTNPKTLTAGTVENAGTLIWDGGTVTQKAGSTFTNLAAGTLDIRGSDTFNIDFSAPAGSAVFNNAGLITKTAGNISGILPTFNNTGAVEVHAGTLTLGRDSSSTGSYAVSSGAQLTFFFGTHTFAPSASITGDGGVNFNESTSTFQGNYAVTGTTTVGSSTASGATTNLTFAPGSTASEFGHLLSINTYGTLTLNTGNTVTIHDLAVWGTLGGADPLIIDGEVTGRGTIQNEILNEGTFSPGASPGTLSVKGDYTQDHAAALKIELASLALVGNKYVQQFDILSIAGQAHLAGTLNLSLLDGYQPQLGDHFDVLTYASHTGVFDQILGTDLPNGLHFNVVYGPTSVELVVAAPEPSALFLLVLTPLFIRRNRRAIAA